MFSGLQLLVIFSLGIAYATQTRIKIGAATWGYQIETNQGRDVRTEFATPDGVVVGSFLYRLGNDTKKLEYRIDPNRMEPDIGFNVTTVSPQQQPNRDARRFTEADESDDSSSGSESSSGSSSAINGTRDDNEIEKDVVTVPNASFDSIDSKQDFKGHVSLKVANRSYVINFVTGDKSNSREESLTSAGMLLGRLNFMGKNSLTKLVINYKFNITSPDPIFEVSLYRTLESESGDSGRGPYQQPFYNNRDVHHHRDTHGHQGARDNQHHNMPHHQSNNNNNNLNNRDSYRDRLTYYNPRQSSPGSSPYSSPYSSSAAAVPISPAVKQQQFLAEKYSIRPSSMNYGRYDDRHRDHRDRDISSDRLRAEPIYRPPVPREPTPTSSSSSQPQSSSSGVSSSSSSSQSNSPTSTASSRSSNDRNNAIVREDSSNSGNSPNQPNWYYPTNRNKIYDP